MCLQISDSQKKQPAKGLPPGWTYLFSADSFGKGKSGQSYVPGLGLSLYQPESNTTFRSIEAAVVSVPELMTFNPNVCSDFNGHIGTLVKGSYSKLKKSSKTAPIPPVAPMTGRTSTMTLEELLDRSCGMCVNCSKDDCGECSSCVSKATSPRRQVCIQKVKSLNMYDFVSTGSAFTSSQSMDGCVQVCCNVSVKQKAQPMPRAANFPEGWKFVIDPTRKSYKNNDFLAPPMKGAYGLKILAPAGHEYYSVKRAKANNKSLLKEVSADAFYEHIGVLRSKSPPKASLFSDGPNGSMQVIPSIENARSTPKSCGACKNCTKPACGKCARCKSGASRQCFQKVSQCSRIANIRAGACN